jgi:hypothetical protein
MAITTEEADARQLAAGHDRARLAALQWAERVETEHREAIRHEDYARTHADKTYLRDAVADERTKAQQRHARSTEARQLAEMWACVAAVLVPPLEPVWSELESTDG